MKETESEAVLGAGASFKKGQIAYFCSGKRRAAVQIRILAALIPTLLGLACGGGGGSSSGSNSLGAKLSAPSLTFASQGIGTTSGSQSVTVTNTGILDLFFSAIAITGANATDFMIGTNTCKGAAILPNTDCAIAITFTPSAVGGRTASLNIADSASGSPQLVTLNGTGSGPLLSLTAAGLTVSQASSTLTFTGEPIGGTDSIVVTATNSGDTNLAISSASISGANTGMFLKTADSCSGVTVAAGGNCMVTVEFKPTAGGALSATLAFADNAFNSPQTVTLGGLGLAPAVSISPNPVIFNDENLLTTSGTTSVAITNSGEESLNISTVTIVGANISDFQIASNPCNGTTITAGSSCLVSIQFAPTALGSRSAALSLTDNASDSPQTVAISGEGTQPVATLSTTSVTFTHQNSGSSSAPQLITISNTGTGPLTISTVALAGANPRAFTISSDACSGTVVAVSDSCTLRVGFSPPGSATYTAALNFSDNAAGTTQEVTLTGMGTAPMATISSPSLAFSGQNLGTTSTVQSVILSNAGTGNLMVSAVSLSGTNSSDFVTSDDACTGAIIMPGNNCMVSLVFKPSAAGIRNALLNFADNAPNTPQSVALSGTAITPSISLTPSADSVALGETFQFGASVGGVSTTAVTWSVNGIPGGSGTVGTITQAGLYTAPTIGLAQLVTVAATLNSNANLVASASLAVISPGTVTTTNNPQVAQYSISVPEASKVYVQFGPDTNYGLTTSTQSTPTVGGSVQILVAGMRGYTTYHLRAVVQFLDGTQYTDLDQTFTTGGLSPIQLPSITASASPGMTPNGGIEMLDLLVFAGTSKAEDVVATDLNGNVVWYYDPGPAMAGLSPNPVKLLPNGHLLVNYSSPAGESGLNSVLQEVDLAGNLIWQMTAADLNAALAAAGYNFTVAGTHHDIAVLPNGHLILLAGESQQFTNLTGYPGITTVWGDVLIDLDTNHQPVWAWSEFDHLDVNRHPMNFPPDWTHTNAVVYSPSDGDLVISVRHQHWVIKIDYNNGLGSSEILWKLGWQGDFTLNGGADPVDWFYAQHGPSFVSNNTAGVFQMTLFDNGDNRPVNDLGAACGDQPTSSCNSRVPLIEVNETALTATILWEDPLSMFSFFGGNAEALANGNMEFDECAAGGLSSAASVYEVTKDTATPETVWQMQIAGQNAYRAMRLPSLYPGVQW